MRFDYSGHGESEGRFEDGTISRWLDDSLDSDRAHSQGAADPRRLFDGRLDLASGGQTLGRAGETAPAGMVLIAPAVDFTERLIWDQFTEDMKRSHCRDRESIRGPRNIRARRTPITLGLIEDGRRHLLFDAPIQTGCPVHILQGMEDPDVPWTHAMRLVEHLPGDNVSLTLIKDGDHRLSGPEDLDRLIAAIEAIA